MRLLQYFAPASWAADNSRDLDLSAEPALLPGGRVLIAGKSAIAYLLNGAHLGGIGGQLAATAPVCGANIDGGTAVTGSTVYLPCGSGIVAVRAKASPPGLQPLWSSQTGGGPPIVAGGLVWTLSQGGTLYGLDPRTGQVRQQAAVGTPANHFPTPSVGAGLMLAPAANRVVAFHATGGPGAAAALPAQASAPGQASGQAPAGGGLSGSAVAGIVAAIVVVVGGIGWLLWRRVLARP
jgi:outer membrane protein assembly factor BamB